MAAADPAGNPIFPAVAAPGAAPGAIFPPAAVRVVVGSGGGGAESSIILAARHAGAPAWFGRSDDDERIARIFVMMKGKPGVVFKEGYGWVLEGETILESIGKLYDPEIKKVVEGGKEETFLFATCQCRRSDCAMVCDYTARVTRNKKGGLDFEGGPLKRHILRAHKGVLFLGVVGDTGGGEAGGKKFRRPCPRPACAIFPSSLARRASHSPVFPLTPPAPTPPYLPSSPQVSVSPDFM